jgi:hypothetical protein
MFLVCCIFSDQLFRIYDFCDHILMRLVANMEKLAVPLCANNDAGKNRYLYRS